MQITSDDLRRAAEVERALQAEFQVGSDAWVMSQYRITALETARVRFERESTERFMRMMRPVVPYQPLPTDPSQE